MVVLTIMYAMRRRPLFLGSGVNSSLAMKKQPDCTPTKIGQIDNANLYLPTSVKEIQKLSLAAFDFGDALLGRKWLRDPSGERAPTSGGHHERGHAG